MELVLTGIYDWFATALEPRDASLSFAVLFVLFWLGILPILYRRKIFLEV